MAQHSLELSVNYNTSDRELKIPIKPDRPGHNTQDFKIFTTKKILNKRARNFTILWIYDGLVCKFILSLDLNILFLLRMVNFWLFCYKWHTYFLSYGCLWLGNNLVLTMVNNSLINRHVNGAGANGAWPAHMGCGAVWVETKHAPFLLFKKKTKRREIFTMTEGVWIKMSMQREKCCPVPPLP